MSKILRTVLRSGEPPSHEDFSRRRGDKRPSTLSQASTPVAGARPGDGSPQQPGSGSESANRAPGTACVLLATCSFRTLQIILSLRRLLTLRLGP